MTDHELLELAAKAAGIIEMPLPHPPGTWYDPISDEPWHPLTDDGDAFRLATELEMNVFHAANSAYALPSEDDGSSEQKVSYGDAGGKHAATRRAIVRAAAAIGKEIK